MGRNKKDAAQDVLTLYNQMQEDEIIESGKEEIHATLNEIESAKLAHPPNHVRPLFPAPSILKTQR